uniref:flagellar hook-length control protein FliK n=1 Tax=Undibacterium sp. TaxID=1914977 RepID=UPI00375346BD
ASATLNKINPPLAPPPSSDSETALGNIDATQSTELASQLKTNNPNDTRAPLDKSNQLLTSPSSLSIETAVGRSDTTQSSTLASQLKTNNSNDIRATSLVDKSQSPAVLNELKKSIGESLATSSKVNLNSIATGQSQNLSKNIEIPSTTNTQRLTLPAAQAPVISIQTSASSELANDLSTVSLVNPATQETNIHKTSKNTDTALTANTQVQALPAAPILVIPIQAPTDSALANDLSPVTLVKTAASETNASQVNHGVEKPEQSNSMLGSSELFSSALNTEFARAQQEQTVAQESLAIEEFAVNKMTSEVVTPAPIVQAPPAALSSLPVTEYIAARFGTRAWDQAIGQKIVWMVAGGEQTAQLTLNPPDLGPVQVVLSISDNFVDASFVSSHLDVREAIEAAAPKLREMMDNAGISLSGFSVSAESAQSGNPFNSEKSQHSGQSQARNGTKADELVDSAKLNTPTQRPQPGLGLVDTFA